MLGVAGGADAALGFVQHEVARWFTDLQHLAVALDAAELAHFEIRVADHLPVDLDPSFHQ
ncbi:hypothetical protein D3C80_1862520 [compost metagenome]